MKKLYFLSDEDKVRVDEQNKQKYVSIDDLPPFIPFDYDAFVKLKRSELSSEYYFEAQFDDGEETKTVIICDGTRYLPLKIAELVQQNKWFCVAVRHINANKPYHEELSLAIYYDDTAKFHFSDMVHPSGACSEIFVNYADDGYCSYIVAYNQRPLVIGNDDDYSCSMTTCTKQIGGISFDDSRGIDYLAQCLRYLANH